MILKVNNLRKEVTSGDSSLVILDDVSFSLEEGQSLAITGPSGSGKSTLLGLLAGLDSASSGTIFLDNIPIHDQDEEERALIRKEKVGFVFQSFELLPSLTALENVMLPSELKSEADPKSNAEYFLERVGLKDRQQHYPNQLSGGEQQRVAIARALVQDPAFVLADEPTGNLDKESGLNILNILKELNNQGKTVIMITHNQEHADMFEKVIELVDGKVVNR